MNDERLNDLCFGDIALRYVFAFLDDMPMNVDYWGGGRVGNQDLVGRKMRFGGFKFLEDMGRTAASGGGCGLLC